MVDVPKAPPQIISNGDASPWRYLVGDLRTGRVLTEPPTVNGCAFTQQLNDHGSIGPLTIQLDHPDLAKMDWRNLTRPGRAFIGVAYQDVIVAAGPVWSRGYDRGARTLSLSGAGFGSIFDHRKVIPPTGTSNADPGEYSTDPDGSQTETRWRQTLITQAGDTKFTQQRYHDMARQVVLDSMQRQHGTLPLKVPGSTALTGLHNLLIYGYDLPWVGEVLSQLTEVEEGIDIDFQPQWADEPGFVEWQMVLGTIGGMRIQQTGADWQFDGDVEDPGLTNVTLDEDGSELGHVAWETGAGQDRITLIASSANPQLMEDGWPLLDVEEARPKVERHEELMALATAKLRRSYRPTDDWTLTVRADRTPRLGEYRPGHYARVPIGPDDPFLPEGFYRGRITQIRGGSSNDVTLTFANEGVLV